MQPGDTLCNGTGLYNTTGSVWSLVTALVANQTAPCPFNGTTCLNGLVYTYDVGVPYNSTGPCPVVEEATPPVTVSSIAGTLFFLLWAGIGAWALWWAYKSVDRSQGELDELKDIQNSIVKSRLQVFEGDAENELVGFDCSIKTFGDAQCIAAEQELKRIHMGVRTTFGAKVLYSYQMAKYWVARTGLMNLMYVYEFFILSSFFVINPVDWANVPVDNGITNAYSFAKIDLPFTFYIFTFWAVLGVYTIMFIVSALRFSNRATSVFRDVLNKLYSFFLFIVLIPALDICLRQFDCVYTNPNYVYLRKDPSIQCWTGVHIAYAALGCLMAIALYSASLLYITIVRVNVRDFIRFNTLFEVAFLMVRFPCANHGALPAVVTYARVRNITQPGQGAADRDQRVPGQLHQPDCVGAVHFIHHLCGAVWR
jgi:hypothetical protein